MADAMPIIKRKFLDYVRANFFQYMVGNCLECGNDVLENSLKNEFPQRPIKWIFANPTKKQMTDIICPYSQIPFVDSYFTIIYVNNIWDADPVQGDMDNLIRLLAPGGVFVMYQKTTDGQKLENQLHTCLNEVFGYLRMYICIPNNSPNEHHFFAIGIRKPFYDKYGFKQFAA